MNLFQPQIFNNYPKLAAGITLKDPSRPIFDTNYGENVGDDPAKVTSRRAELATHLGFEAQKLVKLSQVHADTIVSITGNEPASDSLSHGHGDALATNQPGYLLTIGVADCAAILLYDPATHAIAAAHSGWRGTQAQVVPKTIEALANQFGTHPSNLLVYISPLAQSCCYEVKADFLTNFEDRYFEQRDGKYYFDNQAVILDQLASAKVKPEHIEADQRCTMEDQNLHSARRDGQSAGRMLAFIGLKS